MFHKKVGSNFTSSVASSHITFNFKQDIANLLAKETESKLQKMSIDAFLTKIDLLLPLLQLDIEKITSIFFTFLDIKPSDILLEFFILDTATIYSILSKYHDVLNIHNFSKIINFFQFQKIHMGKENFQVKGEGNEGKKKGYYSKVTSLDEFLKNSSYRKGNARSLSSLISEIHLLNTIALEEKENQSKLEKNSKESSIKLGDNKTFVAVIDILITLCIFTAGSWELKLKYLFTWFRGASQPLMREEEEIELQKFTSLNQDDTISEDKKKILDEKEKEKLYIQSMELMTKDPSLYLEQDDHILMISHVVKVLVNLNLISSIELNKEDITFMTLMARIKKVHSENKLYQSNNHKRKTSSISNMPVDTSNSSPSNQFTSFNNNSSSGLYLDILPGLNFESFYLWSLNSKEVNVMFSWIKVLGRLALAMKLLEERTTKLMFLYKNKIETASNNFEVEHKYSSTIRLHERKFLAGCPVGSAYITYSLPSFNSSLKHPLGSSVSLNSSNNYSSLSSSSSLRHRSLSSIPNLYLPSLLHNSSNAFLPGSMLRPRPLPIENYSNLDILIKKKEFIKNKLIYYISFISTNEIFITLNSSLCKKNNSSLISNSLSIQLDQLIPVESLNHFILNKKTDQNNEENYDEIYFNGQYYYLSMKRKILLISKNQNSKYLTYSLRNLKEDSTYKLIITTSNLISAQLTPVLFTTLPSLAITKSLLSEYQLYYQSLTSANLTPSLNTKESSSIDLPRLILLPPLSNNSTLTEIINQLNLSFTDCSLIYTGSLINYDDVYISNFSSYLENFFDSSIKKEFQRHSEYHRNSIISSNTSISISNLMHNFTSILTSFLTNMENFSTLNYENNLQNLIKICQLFYSNSFHSSSFLLPSYSSAAFNNIYEQSNGFYNPYHLSTGKQLLYYNTTGPWNEFNIVRSILKKQLKLNFEKIKIENNTFKFEEIEKILYINFQILSLLIEGYYNDLINSIHYPFSSCNMLPNKSIYFLQSKLIPGNLSTSTRSSINTCSNFSVANSITVDDLLELLWEGHMKERYDNLKSHVNTFGQGSNFISEGNDEAFRGPKYEDQPTELVIIMRSPADLIGQFDGVNSSNDHLDLLSFTIKKLIHILPPNLSKYLETSCNIKSPPPSFNEDEEYEENCEDEEEMENIDKKEEMKSNPLTEETKLRGKHEILFGEYNYDHLKAKDKRKKILNEIYLKNYTYTHNESKNREILLKSTGDPLLKEFFSALFFYLTYLFNQKKLEDKNFNLPLVTLISTSWNGINFLLKKKVRIRESIIKEISDDEEENYEEITLIVKHECLLGTSKSKDSCSYSKSLDIWLGCIDDELNQKDYIELIKESLPSDVEFLLLPETEARCLSLSPFESQSILVKDIVKLKSDEKIKNDELIGEKIEEVKNEVKEDRKLYKNKDSKDIILELKSNQNLLFTPQEPSSKYPSLIHYKSIYSSNLPLISLIDGPLLHNINDTNLDISITLGGKGCLKISFYLLPTSINPSDFDRLSQSEEFRQILKSPIEPLFIFNHGIQSNKIVHIEGLAPHTNYGIIVDLCQSNIKKTTSSLRRKSSVSVKSSLGYNLSQSNSNILIKCLAVKSFYTLPSFLSPIMSYVILPLSLSDYEAYFDYLSSNVKGKLKKRTFRLEKFKECLEFYRGSLSVSSTIGIYSNDIVPQLHHNQSDNLLEFNNITFKSLNNPTKISNLYPSIHYNWDYFSNISRNTSSMSRFLSSLATTSTNASNPSNINFYSGLNSTKNDSLPINTILNESTSSFFIKHYGKVATAVINTWNSESINSFIDSLNHHAIWENTCALIVFVGRIMIPSVIKFGMMTKYPSEIQETSPENNSRPITTESSRPPTSGTQYSAYSSTDAMKNTNKNEWISTFSNIFDQSEGIKLISALINWKNLTNFREVRVVATSLVQKVFSISLTQPFKYNTSSDFFKPVPDTTSASISKSNTKSLSILEESKLFPNILNEESLHSIKVKQSTLNFGITLQLLPAFDPQSLEISENSWLQYDGQFDPDYDDDNNQEDFLIVRRLSKIEGEGQVFLPNTIPSIPSKDKNFNFRISDTSKSHSLGCGIFYTVIKSSKFNDYGIYNQPTHVSLYRDSLQGRGHRKINLLKKIKSNRLKVARGVQKKMQIPIAPPEPLFYILDVLVKPQSNMALSGSHAENIINSQISLSINDEDNEGSNSNLQKNILNPQSLENFNNNNLIQSKLNYSTSMVIRSIVDKADLVKVVIGPVLGKVGQTDCRIMFELNSYTSKVICLLRLAAPTDPNQNLNELSDSQSEEEEDDFYVMNQGEELSDIELPPIEDSEEKITKSPKRKSMKKIKSDDESKMEENDDEEEDDEFVVKNLPEENKQKLLNFLKQSEKRKIQEYDEYVEEDYETNKVNWERLGWVRDEVNYYHRSKREYLLEKVQKERDGKKKSKKSKKSKKIKKKDLTRLYNKLPGDLFLIEENVEPYTPFIFHFKGLKPGRTYEIYLPQFYSTLSIGKVHTLPSPNTPFIDFLVTSNIDIPYNKYILNQFHLQQLPSLNHFTQLHDIQPPLISSFNGTNLENDSIYHQIQQITKFHPNYNSLYPNNLSLNIQENLQINLYNNPWIGIANELSSTSSVFSGNITLGSQSFLTHLWKQLRHTLIHAAANINRINQWIKNINELRQRRDSVNNVSTAESKTVTSSIPVQTEFSKLPNKEWLEYIQSLYINDLEVLIQDTFRASYMAPSISISYAIAPNFPLFSQLYCITSILNDDDLLDLENSQVSNSINSASNFGLGGEFLESTDSIDDINSFNETSTLGSNNLLKSTSKILIRKIFERQLKKYLFDLYPTIGSSMYRVINLGPIALALIDSTTSRTVKNSIFVSYSSCVTYTVLKGKKNILAHPPRPYDFDPIVYQEQMRQQQIQQQLETASDTNNEVSNDLNNQQSVYSLKFSLFSPFFIDSDQWTKIKALTNLPGIHNLNLFFEHPLISLYPLNTPPNEFTKYFSGFYSSNPVNPLSSVSQVDLTNVMDELKLEKGEVIPWGPIQNDLIIFFTHFFTWISLSYEESRSLEKKSLTIICNDEISYITTIQDVRNGFKIHQISIGQANPLLSSSFREPSTQYDLSKIVLKGKITNTIRYSHQLLDLDYSQLESHSLKLPSKSIQNVSLTNSNILSQINFFPSAGYGKLRIWADGSNPINEWININLSNLIFKPQLKLLGHNSLINNSVHSLSLTNLNSSIIPTDLYFPSEPNQSVILTSGPIFGLPYNRVFKLPSSMKFVNKNDDFSSMIFIPLSLEVNVKSDIVLEIKRLLYTTDYNSSIFKLTYLNILPNTLTTFHVGPLYLNERYEIKIFSSKNNNYKVYNMDESSDSESENVNTNLKQINNENYIISTHYSDEETNFIVLNESQLPDMMPPNDTNEENDISSKDEEKEKKSKKKKKKDKVKDDDLTNDDLIDYPILEYSATYLPSTLHLSSLIRRLQVPYHGINCLIHTNFERISQSDFIGREFISNFALVHEYNYWHQNKVITSSLYREVFRLINAIRIEYQKHFNQPSLKKLFKVSGCINLLLPAVTDIIEVIDIKLLKQQESELSRPSTAPTRPSSSSRPTSSSRPSSGPKIAQPSSEEEKYEELKKKINKSKNVSRKGVLYLKKHLSIYEESHKERSTRLLQLIENWILQEYVFGTRFTGLPVHYSLIDVNCSEDEYEFINHNNQIIELFENSGVYLRSCSPTELDILNENTKNDDFSESESEKQYTEDEINEHNFPINHDKFYGIDEKKKEWISWKSQILPNLNEFLSNQGYTNNYMIYWSDPSLDPTSNIIRQWLGGCQVPPMTWSPLIMKNKKSSVEVVSIHKESTLKLYKQIQIKTLELESVNFRLIFLHGQSNLSSTFSPINQASDNINIFSPVVASNSGESEESSNVTTTIQEFISELYNWKIMNPNKKSVSSAAIDTSSLQQLYTRKYFLIHPTSPTSNFSVTVNSEIGINAKSSQSTATNITNNLSIGSKSIILNAKINDSIIEFYNVYLIDSIYRSNIATRRSKLIEMEEEARVLREKMLKGSKQINQKSKKFLKKKEEEEKSLRDKLLKKIKKFLLTQIPDGYLFINTQASTISSSNLFNFNNSFFGSDAFANISSGNNSLFDNTDGTSSSGPTTPSTPGSTQNKKNYYFNFFDYKNYNNRKALYFNRYYTLIQRANLELNSIEVVDPYAVKKPQEKESKKSELPPLPPAPTEISVPLLPSATPTYTFLSFTINYIGDWIGKMISDAEESFNTLAQEDLEALYNAELKNSKDFNDDDDDEDDINDINQTKEDRINKIKKKLKNNIINKSFLSSDFLLITDSIYNSFLSYLQIPKWIELFINQNEIVFVNDIILKYIYENNNKLKFIDYYETNKESLLMLFQELYKKSQLNSLNAFLQSSTDENIINFNNHGVLKHFFSILLNKIWNHLPLVLKDHLFNFNDTFIQSFCLNFGLKESKKNLEFNYKIELKSSQILKEKSPWNLTHLEDIININNLKDPKLFSHMIYYSLKLNFYLRNSYEFYMKNHQNFSIFEIKNQVIPSIKFKIDPNQLVESITSGNNYSFSTSPEIPIQAYLKDANNSIDSELVSQILKKFTYYNETKENILKNKQSDEIIPMNISTNKNFIFVNDEIISISNNNYNLLEESIHRTSKLYPSNFHSDSEFFLISPILLKTILRDEKENFINGIKKFLLYKYSLSSSYEKFIKDVQSIDIEAVKKRKGKLIKPKMSTKKLNKKMKIKEIEDEEVTELLEKANEKVKFITKIENDIRNGLKDMWLEEITPEEDREYDLSKDDFFIDLNEDISKIQFDLDEEEKYNYYKDLEEELKKKEAELAGKEKGTDNPNEVNSNSQNIQENESESESESEQKPQPDQTFQEEESEIIDEEDQAYLSKIEKLAYIASNKVDDIIIDEIINEIIFVMMNYFLEVYSVDAEGARDEEVELLSSAERKFLILLEEQSKYRKKIGQRLIHFS